VTSARWFGVIALAFALAAGVSGTLYLRSRSADFDSHARAVEAIGRLRHLDRQLAEQVLASRFGLLNQYDPLTSSELELVQALASLRSLVVGTVGASHELDAALRSLEASVGERRLALDHFKAENSVLKNSLRYLPTAGEELTRELGARVSEPVGHDVNALVRAALVYDLIGDRGTREAYLSSVERVRTERGELTGGVGSDFDALLAHARVIAEHEPSVDAWLRRASNDDVGDRIGVLEATYQAEFASAAAKANRYRKILYGWSLFLVVTVAAVGVQLRKVYASLERRVAERTAELARALDALWGEMKLARRIQEALVPTSPELVGCDVAASMKPAEEVGGDYYDVIRTKTHEWILIGDVSGHGVAAGLVMMMCQTAVRTALERDPELMPDRLLVLVNAVLTENIRQLGEDRYMTITALRRDAGGTLRFAGAHTDLFVYRQQTDSVEAVATSGLWLGLKPDAEGAFTTRELTLTPGDLLVLHTDGVTEAMCEGRMFDTAGLHTTLSRAKGKTARQVLDDLMGALDGYELRDDATLLVIRELDAAPHAS
jgi:serine phosphatase RsbU (regulator of sigma subunit)